MTVPLCNRCDDTLKSIEQSVMWWIGDWLRFGKRRWGDRYAQAMEATERSHQTLRDAMWVANEFDLSRWRDNLSWSHHQEVAGDVASKSK
jgi:hypothetical protein